MSRSRCGYYLGYTVAAVVWSRALSSFLVCPIMGIPNIRLQTQTYCSMIHCLTGLLSMLHAFSAGRDANYSKYKLLANLAFSTAFNVYRAFGGAHRRLQCQSIWLQGNYFLMLA